MAGRGATLDAEGLTLTEGLLDTTASSAAAAAAAEGDAAADLSAGVCTVYNKNLFLFLFYEKGGKGGWFGEYQRKESQKARQAARQGSTV